MVGLPASGTPTLGSNPAGAQVLAHLPNARGVLVTAGARGSAYAFRPAGGKATLTARVPVLKVRISSVFQL